MGIDWNPISSLQSFLIFQRYVHEAESDEEFKGMEKFSL